MHTEQLTIHQRTQGKTVEHLHTRFPHRRSAILLHTLVIETIYLRDLTAFVVATEKRDAIGIANLQGQQQKERFHAEMTSVDIITQKQVVCIRTVTSNREQFQHIIELAVNVSANLQLTRNTQSYGDRSVNFQNITLLHQNLLRLTTQRNHFLLGNQLALL